MIATRFAATRAKQDAEPGPDAVTIAEVRAHVVTLQDGGLSPSSVAGFVRRLKAIFGWCAPTGSWTPIQCAAWLGRACRSA
jgi:hypothetical protein